MTEPHPSPALASAVLDARRGTGHTPAALAHRAGVDVSVVETIERGDAAHPAQALAVLGALGLDPVPHLGGAPFGPVPVRPLDADHARVMTYVGEVADCSEGWLVFPDAAAVPAIDHDPAELEAAQAARDAHEPWTMRLSRGLFYFGFPWTVASALATVLVAGASGHAPSPAWRMASQVTVGAALAGMASALAGICLLLVSDLLEGGHAAEVARLRLVHEAWERRRGEVSSMTRNGYVVSERGVTMHHAGARGPDRRDYPASTFRSVRVTDADRDHVDVTVDTILGEVAMPWLPRTPDLLALTRRWSERAGSTGAKLEGPQ